MPKQTGVSFHQRPGSAKRPADGLDSKPQPEPKRKALPWRTPPVDEAVPQQRVGQFVAPKAKARLGGAQLCPAVKAEAVAKPQLVDDGESGGENIQLEHPPFPEPTSEPERMVDCAGRTIRVAWRQVVPEDPEQTPFAAGCQVRLAPGVFNEEWLAHWMSKLASSKILIRPINEGGRPLNRNTAWFTPDGCHCAYSYGGIALGSASRPGLSPHGCGRSCAS